jgi:hypothetical protein
MYCTALCVVLRIAVQREAKRQQKAEEAARKAAEAEEKAAAAARRKHKAEAAKAGFGSTTGLSKAQNVFKVWAVQMTTTS